MGSAISKRMQLLLEWKDREFQSGVDRSKRGMDELKKRALQVAKAILATTAAVVGLTAGLLKLIKQGSEVKSVQESFEGFVRAAEMSPDTLARVRASVRGTISDMELMNVSVRALSAGLDPGRVVEFWQKAKQIADVSSQDTLVVFENLVMGMTKLEVETLKTIGITIRAEDVYKQYAASIGKTQAQLTTYDRTVAFSIALEEKYRKNFLAVGDVTTRVREKFQQLGAGVKNVWNKFVVMVAESPKVMGFLAFLSGEVGNIDEKLKSMQPGLDRVIATMILMGRKGVGAAKGVASYKNEIVGVGSVIAGMAIIAKLKGIASAFGLIGTAGMTAGAGAALIVAPLTIIAFTYKKILGKILDDIQGWADSFLGVWEDITIGIYKHGDLISHLPGGEALADKAGEWSAAIAEARISLKARVDDWKGDAEDMPSLFDLLIGKAFGKSEEREADIANIEDEIERVIGGLWKGFEEAQSEGRRRAKEQAARIKFFEMPKIEAPAVAAFEAEAKAPKRDREKLAMLDEEEQAFIDSWDRRVEYAQTASDILLSIEEGRYLSNSELWEIERIDFLRNMQIREQSYSAGYQAMGQYSERFFARNAKMGRILNAMLIRGATEAVASWIDAKTKEWRYQALANTYEMFAALARKDFYAAGMFGKAALGWGALAGSAAIASGGIRYAGQQKAEGMMTEQETQWEEATGGEGEDMGRQKREASGIVKTRPIHINVYSTANFNSGYMIFGDSETAAGELYSDHFRDRIESDIESGAIQIA